MRLNRRESGLIMGMLMLSAFLWAPFLTIKAALGSDDDELVPQRTPLVDLCIWFPYPKVAQLVPEPRAPLSQSIFYGVVQCDWASADDRTLLSLSAYRPSGALTREKESSEVLDFYSRALPDDGEPAGIGEMSTVGVRQEPDYAEAHVVVRDGLLVTQVTYRVPGKGAGVAAQAKEAAVELLRLLPPKGR
ncbi:hypothetical protein [Actinomadura latina]|uniref:Uncharacterized protein n=1 Tax=Actinomadura latina TaxID=163603 RepID=A0A846YWF9_9ACTN|nr:hypothetical protein [Actinomadura latina]NKZ02828.1 hypothetical protein [Actinomadura latina]